MSYNPHDFKQLFPKGLFGLPNKKFENFNESQKLFALNQEPSPKTEKQLAPGLVMKTGHLKIGKGFVNYLISEIDPQVRNVEVFYSRQPVYPVKAFSQAKNAKFLTNLGYFYLPGSENEWDKEKHPRNRAGNLVVYRSKLIGLPIFDRSALLVYKSGQVDLRVVKSIGHLRIGTKVCTWSGSNTTHKTDVKIYTSNNVEVINVIDPTIGPVRKIKLSYITCSKGKKLVACKINSHIKIEKISNLDFPINKSDLLIEMDNETDIKVGDSIEILDIDGIQFSSIKFAASSGPTLKLTEQERKNQLEKEGIDRDFFLSSFPFGEDKILARGCLVLLPDGRMATVAIDGIPQAGEIYPGVTPGQLADFVRTMYPNFSKAMFTDPANTVKVVYSQNGEVEIFGNLHYLNYVVGKKGQVKFWPNGRNGRKIHTMLVVK